MEEDSIVEQKTWQVYCFGKRNVVQLYLNESKKKTVTHRHTYADTHTHTHIYKHQSFTLVYQSDLLVGVGGGVIVPVFFTFIYLFTVLLL